MDSKKWYFKMTYFVWLWSLMDLMCAVQLLLFPGFAGISSWVYLCGKCLLLSVDFVYFEQLARSTATFAKTHHLLNISNRMKETGIWHAMLGYFSFVKLFDVFLNILSFYIFMVSCWGYISRTLFTFKCSFVEIFSQDQLGF